MENCENIRELILLDLDDMCTPEEQARIQIHLAHCSECASYQKEMQQLTAGVQQWGKDVPSLPEDFTAQVMAHIQAQPTTPAQTGKQPKKVIHLGRWLALGASAAALALVFLTTNGNILPANGENTLAAPSTSVSQPEDTDASSDTNADANTRSNEAAPFTALDVSPQPELAQDEAAPASGQEKAPSSQEEAPAQPSVQQSAPTQPSSHTPPSVSSKIHSPEQEDSRSTESATSDTQQPKQNNLQDQQPVTIMQETPDDSGGLASSAYANGAELPASVTGLALLTPSQDGEEALTQQLSSFSKQADGYLIEHQQWPQVRQWCEENQVEIQLEGTEDGDIFATVQPAQSVSEKESTPIILPDPVLSTQTP